MYVYIQNTHEFNIHTNNTIHRFTIIITNTNLARLRAETLVTY